MQYEQRICRPGALRKCLHCDPVADDAVKHKCDLCREDLPMSAHPAGMWHHRTDVTRGTLCRDCCRPKCTRVEWKTCKECRDPSCDRGRTCIKKIERLHPKQLPTSLEQLQNWLCAACRQRCDLCREDLPISAYPAGMWKNRADVIRKTLCRDCCRPKCTQAQCQTCKDCRDPRCDKGRKCSKKIESLHPKQLPTSLEQLQNWLCTACRQRCDLCREDLPMSAYPAGMWKHRADVTRKTLCRDCCRPKCTRAQCKTCKACRDPTCKGSRKCVKEIKSLNAKQLLMSLEQLDHWLCDTCKYIVCQSCAKDMSQKQQRRVKNASSKKLWTCGDCLSLQESQAALAKYT